MITKAQALTEREFHYNGGCPERLSRSTGKDLGPEAWRRNGITQVWKTRPDNFRVPVKWGLKGYDEITQATADQFHVPADCPRSADD